ncbi:MAG: hypothetical protein IKH88_16740 [Prevotella sp.]|nr:hypothetical protein [Prevotella sp.]
MGNTQIIAPKTKERPTVRQEPQGCFASSPTSRVSIDGFGEGSAKMSATCAHQ